MNRLSFVLWVLGWPLIIELSNHWMRLDGKLYISEIKGHYHTALGNAKITVLLLSEMMDLVDGRLVDGKGVKL